LKSHLRVTIRTLLQGGASQREIERVTGVDRKTIRRYEREVKSPGVATGSEPGKNGGSQTLSAPKPARFSSIEHETSVLSRANQAIQVQSISSRGRTLDRGSVARR
jgi:hypothetical protein